MTLLWAFRLEFSGMLALMLLSAFFSGSETALFSLRREQLRRMEGQPGAVNRAILWLSSRPEGILATILFGNMVVNVLYFSIAYKLTSATLERFGKTDAVVLQVVTFLALVTMSEVLPKGIAVRRPYAVSRLVALPLLFIARAIGPIRVGLSHFARRATTFFRPRAEDASYIGTDELKMLLEMSENEGMIDSRVSNMLQRVIEFHEIRLKEILVPRVDMASFDLAGSSAEFMALVRNERHRRIPVYENSVDNIVGVIRSRDVFLNPDRPLRELMMPVHFVPDTKTIESMLRDFRERHEKLAVVVDEYGGTAGLVTLEDILEVVVGEIEDEFDISAPAVERVGENAWRVAADLGTHDWAELFSVELGSPRFETVAGFVISLLGRMPRQGDTVTYRGLRFRVEEIRGRRIRTIRVEVMDEGEAPEADDG